MMKKWIKCLLYAFTVLLCIYLMVMDGLILYLQYLGVPLVLLHPYLVDFDTASKVEIIPQIIRFIYILITSLFFIYIGYKKLHILHESSRGKK